MMTQRLLGRDGTLRALELVRIEVLDGRPVPIPDSSFEIEADMLLLAIGFVGPRTQALVDQLGIELSPRGNVAVDDQHRTSVPGLYSAGDCSRGASLIVWAIADGREAARTIDMDLQDDNIATLPTKGRDCAFGGR